jgi:uncharacterized LabA/DUF88 family protein
MNQTRVAFYIDGFNLYFGLREKGWKRYYWLNILELCDNLLLSNQVRITAKYFTARVTAPPDKVRRQSIYLDALKTLEPQLQIIEGNYLTNTYKCKHCGFEYLDSKEKMTDVNIAVEMASDLLDDKFDTAILISADGDLVPAIKLIKKINNKKRIIVGFPPNRFSEAIEKVADHVFLMYRQTFAKSVFPPVVTTSTGFQLIKPLEWQ